MKRFCSPLSRGKAGFTLADTVIAAGVAVAALGAFYASTQQAGRVLRMGKEMAAATELLQERIEALRYAPPWGNVTTAAGIATVTAGAPGVSANFKYLTETFTVQGYPSGSTLIVTRSPSGTFTNNGVDLYANTCVKVTVTATWMGVGSVQRTKQLSTIIAKGGI